VQYLQALVLNLVEDLYKHKNEARVAP
jgi:hypothetical protein